MNAVGAIFFAVLAARLFAEAAAAENRQLIVWTDGALCAGCIVGAALFGILYIGQG
jgi:hypothetical protein